MNCKHCHSEMFEKISDVTHVLSRKEILIKNVPIIACPNLKCNHSFYLYPSIVDDILSEAFRNQLSSVEFKMPLP